MSEAGDASRRLRSDNRDGHHGSGQEETRKKSGAVKHLSPEEITQIKDDLGRTVIAPTPPPPPRDSAGQIDALLIITDRQLRNLENASLLADAQVLQLGRLADIIVSLHRAQGGGGGKGDDPSGMSDEQLRELAGKKS